MKKRNAFALLIALLCLLCVFALVACNNTPETPDAGGNGDQTEQGGNGGGTQGGGDVTPHMHTYSAWTTITPATCGASGVETRTCACGNKEERIIDPTGLHEYGKDNLCTICKIPYMYTTGLLYKKCENKDTYCVVGIENSTETDVVIPRYYNGLPVSEIADQAFYGSCIKSVMISAFVESIGEEAFSDCCFLEQVNFEKNCVLESLGTMAFGGCLALNSITVPASVTNIEAAFSGSCLRSVSFEEGSQLTKIGRGAFDECQLLLTVVIPPSVTQIEEYAFDQCYSLHSLVLPASVSEIGENAFNECFSLIEVYNLSPLSIQAGDAAFGGVGLYAKNVYTASAGESKLFYDELGFVFYKDDSSCYLVRYNGSDHFLTLPDNYQGQNYEIYPFSFAGNKNLVSLEVPYGVKGIGKSAFNSCSNLTSLTIPSSIAYIGEGAFANCLRVLEVYNFAADGILNSFDVWWGFCSPLVVHTDATQKSKVFIDENGYVFYEDEDNCYLNGYVGGERELTLPADCKGQNYEIYKGAFDVSQFPPFFLGSVTIPSSVTAIGESAFSGQEWLKTIIFNNGSQLLKIDQYAFWQCLSLETIKIPSSVTVIGEGAFENCENLMVVELSKSLTEIGEDAFKGCIRLYEVYNFSENLEILVGSEENGKIAYHALKVYTSATEEKLAFVEENDFVFAYSGDKWLLLMYVGDAEVLVLPTEIRGNNYEVYCSAFKNSVGIKDITISSGVTVVGEKAFENCYELANVKISPSVTRIGEGAFANCQDLVEVCFEEGSQLKIIEKETFMNCIALSSISIPIGVTDIKENAFLCCHGLQTIILPAKVKSVGKQAFYYCSGLKTVTIENNSDLQCIGEGAFYWCENLSTVDFGANSQLNYIGKSAFQGCNLSSVVCDADGWEIKVNDTTTIYPELTPENLMTNHCEGIWER